MPAAELEAPFAELCASAGVVVRRGVSIDGLTGRGHFDFEPLDESGEQALSTLRQVFEALKGDPDAMSVKPSRPIKPDFVLPDTRHVLELDEEQHFTTARLRALDCYESGNSLLFDIDEYRRLCERHLARADNAFAHKQAAEFPGPHGRQRQRAYFDAVRDLLVPELGYVGVFRVPVPHREIHRGFEALQENPAWPYWERVD
jgi:hypothetical protein